MAAGASCRSRGSSRSCLSSFFFRPPAARVRAAPCSASAVRRTRLRSDSAATASTGSENAAGIRPAPTSNRPWPPSRRSAVAAAFANSFSVGPSHGMEPVASPTSRAALHRTTRSTIAAEPRRLTVPSADTSRRISSPRAETASRSRQRQASISQNKRDTVSTNRADCVSPAASGACADRADLTSRSSRPPAEPPARRVRAIQANPQVAASHKSHRSRSTVIDAASSRQSLIAPSMSVMCCMSCDRRSICRARRRRRRRTSSDSLTSAIARMRRPAGPAPTFAGARLASDRDVVSPADEASLSPDCPLDSAATASSSVFEAPFSRLPDFFPDCLGLPLRVCVVFVTMGFIRAGDSRGPGSDSHRP